MKRHILKVFNDSSLGRDVWAPVTIALCRNMAFDGIKFYEMYYLCFHVIHLAPATRSLIRHPAEHVWQQMVQGSLLSYLLSSSLCPVQPLTLQRYWQPLHLSPSVTDAQEDGETPEGGLLVILSTRCWHSWVSSRGSKAINRASRDAVVLSLLWMGGGGVCSFQWHQLLTPAERPLCHKEIMINTSLSPLAHLKGSCDFFFIYF